MAALAQESPPDVILLDINLGAESGIDAIQPIKSLAPTVRVLMLTTFYNSQEEAEALRAGASVFLTKINSVEQIVECIRQPRLLPRFAATVPGFGCRTSQATGLVPQDVANPSEDAAARVAAKQRSRALWGRVMRLIRRFSGLMGPRSAAT